MIKAFFIESSQADYTAEEFSWFQKFWLEEGVFGDSAGSLGLQASENSPTGMSVLVSAGNGLVEITVGARTWKVIVMSESAQAIAIPANSSGTSRVDAIILRVDNNTEPNALKNNVATIERIAGSGGEALTDGAIDTAVGGDGWIRLADIYVLNGATEILDVDIADMRTRTKSNEAIRFSPKALEFRAYTSDPGPDDLMEGMMWFNSTDHTMKYYDGSTVANMVTVMMTTSGNQISGTNKVVDENDTTNGATKTAATISFTASTKTIADSGNGFVTAGFRVGESVAITGSGSNNGTYTLMSVAAGAMTVAESLVNESVGASVTIAAVKANKVARLDANGKLPASDGSKVTGMLLENVVTGYEIVTGTDTVDYNTAKTASITLTAPAGKKFIGGGASFTGGNQVPYMQKCYPASATSWVVTVVSLGGTSAATVTAYAIAVKISS